MKIFLSSTYIDLVNHRARVAEAIERLGQQGIRMEVFGARPNEATRASLNEVDESDVFVGIYAHRYGHIPLESKLSITEMEFDQARQQGLPVLAFVVDDDHPWLPKYIDDGPDRNRLALFKDRIGSSLIRDSFTTPEDLAFKVAASLGRYLLQQKLKSELAQAATSGAEITEQVLDQVARRAARLAAVVGGARVLLVNDVPSEMSHVIQILRDLSVSVEVVRDSRQALDLLSSAKFDAIVSDMARDGVADEGLRFLSAMRKTGWSPPIVFTVGQYEPERGIPAYAFGITNRVDDLINYLLDIFDRTRG